jgi:hypothetical protein
LRGNVISARPPLTIVEGRFDLFDRDAEEVADAPDQRF